MSNQIQIKVAELNQLNPLMIADDSRVEQKFILMYNAIWGTDQGTQIYEKEKQNDMMINILSHIVEFRNGESGLHILHIHILTELMLQHLIHFTDRYPMTQTEINLICTASAPPRYREDRDPGEILNKPGRLTDEEFAIMKTHTTIGSTMLKSIPAYQDEPLMKMAHNICRWHHERYNGKGYPDGLKGDEIPISAQIVAMADVYDALTSERLQKSLHP